LTATASISDVFLNQDTILNSLFLLSFKKQIQKIIQGKKPVPATADVYLFPDIRMGFKKKDTADKSSSAVFLFNKT